MFYGLRRAVHKNCTAPLEMVDHLPSDFRFCSNLDTRFYNLNDCMLSFAGQDNKPVCITQGSFNALSKEVFNHCANNPVLGFGGCYDLEDSGRVCVRNFEIKDPGTCVQYLQSCRIYSETQFALYTIHDAFWIGLIIFLRYLIQIFIFS